jgi:hypothetical protein
VAAKYADVFRADKTRHLITRLRHNVIRTGLRRIATAYSRISLEVCVGGTGLGCDWAVQGHGGGMGEHESGAAHFCF